MNLAAALSVSSAILGFFVALLCLALSRAPRWSELRWFATMSAAAGLYGASDIPISLEIGLPLATLATRINVLAAGIHVIAWIPYGASLQQRPLRRLDRWVIAVALATLVVPLFPGLLVLPDVTWHSVPWLGVRYLQLTPTALGSAIFVFYCAVLLIPLVDFARRFAKSEEGAGWHLLALTLLFATAASDTVTAVFQGPMPFLLDLGFAGVVVLIGTTLVRRFIATAHTFEELSTQLERTVAVRTGELVTASQALQRAEKLAAIGQLAAGVAHEVNNPTAVVRSNLDYLRARLEEDNALPDDTADCLDESLVSLDRIARIVQQLLDAGRSAAQPDAALAPVSVLDAVSRVVRDARSLISSGVELCVDVDPTHRVVGSRPLLEQVLLNLVVNGAQAIAQAQGHGRVTVRSEITTDQVQLLVTDDGPGIAPQVQAHLFEPFVTTKAPGRGTGLGLSVSLGLMRAQGGQLTLRKSDAAGTTFAVALALTSAKVPEPVVAGEGAPVPLRLLLVDDEPMILSGLKRQLGRYFLTLETAPTIAQAVGRLKQPAPAIDLVLCDVMMPDGGAEQLLLELEAAVPPVRVRTLFMTGGAMTGVTQRFVAEHPSHVLFKPINPGALLEQLERLP